MFTYRAIKSKQQSSGSEQQQQQQQQQEQQHPITTVTIIENAESAECRIINLQLLQGHIEDVTKHVASCLACQKIAQSSDSLTMIGEKQEGLASIIGCKFKGCGHELIFNTSTKTKGLTGKMFWTNNLAAVWGQMTTGGGFNTLEESLSVLNVPVMTKQSCMHTEQIIGKWWWSVLEESMKAAGRQERQIAINKQQHHHSVPAITVIVDAGWSKCTHKHSYNALSCVGVIFGKETKNFYL